MKNVSGSKLTVAALVCIIAVAAIYFFLPSGKNETSRLTPDPAFAAYINSYTAGVINSGSVLNVVFASEMVDSSRIGEQVGESLFDFDPSLNGAAFWIDDRTLQFRPAARMKSGQVYTAKLSLSKLVPGLPDNLRTFSYSFRIVPQNYELEIVNVKPASRTERNKGIIEGHINTADFAEESHVEDLMTAIQDGKKLNLSWTHTTDGKVHRFVVDGVERKAQAGKVGFRVDGKSLGVERTEEVEVDVPALDEFKVTNVRVVQSPTQYVVLQFSDFLSEKQNLAGLITIDDLPSLDFDIHGNEIRVYPPVVQNGTRRLTVNSGIRNAMDVKLERSVTKDVLFEQLKPAVRFAGRGTILPSTDGLVVPFEAVNLRAVDVRVLKVYEDNVLRFLQVNDFQGKNELRRVGKRMLKKTISLENMGITDPGKWNRYTLDVSQLIASEPGAIYEIKLSFKKSYTAFACSGSAEAREPIGEIEYEDDLGDAFTGEDSYGYYDDYYDEVYYGVYDWNQRDNPCHASYYTPNRWASKNILASDLGLTAKRGEDGNTHVFVTDLLTAKPLSGTEVTLFSFQLQKMGAAFTDKDGKVVLESKEQPFAVVARHGTQRGYLRLVNGETLLTSNFDVSGQVVQKGLKGFLYGERGVWRPGDSLHLTFILEDKRDLLPANHPVVFELSDPHGQVVNRLVRSKSDHGFYRFSTATRSDAPTGNWLGKVKVGGTEFSQTLKIETVKPNRLKINLDFGRDKLTSPDLNGTLRVNWLHGAPGRNLKAEFEVTLVQQPTTFKAFPGYNFDDPSREFWSESQQIFDGHTSDAGVARVNATMELSGSPSGVLNAVFRGRVYEEGGNFSVDRFSIPYYHYPSFVGLKVPEGERYSGVLHTDKHHIISLATVNVEGRPIARKEIEIRLYKLSWRWWWDNTGEYLANFVEGPYTQLVREGKVSTSADGKGTWSFNLETAEYGRYFLRACDSESGHCAGEVIYVDEPGWWDRARAEGARGGANLLSFSTDKTTYNIGERIQITIPGIDQGRALVSIENGSKVLETHWVETSRSETVFSVEATEAMSPNAYVHVSLLQPHAQTENDLPVRLYGMTSIGVENPDSHLEPVIDIPDKLVPGEPVTIRVLEKSNRRMTFTVAMVDEGLLDLTRFQTPDPWRVFYAKEALGVRTWDVFDNVVGAFGASLERFISIGGDDALMPGEVDPLANRFTPVVKFFGPYTIDGGPSDIRFTMPQYVGAVRTMVVAGFDGAYGKAEKVSTVKKPLMVLATLPRVLGPGETVNLPITLFTGDTGARDVQVSVSVKGPVAVSGEKSKSVSMGANSDETTDFRLAVGNETGIASIEVTATAGNLKATDAIEIQVRSSNVPVTRVSDFLLEQGKSINATLTPFGMEGTHTAVLEVSSLPPINLESRLRYLLEYPHGCAEQTVSYAFPQLYLTNVKELTEAEKGTIQRNVKAAIERIRAFAQPDGGIGYWPGSESSDSWSTAYAGHFLVEAQAKGYYVPDDLMFRWKSFQRAKANAWRRRADVYNSDLLQAYRLYTLALAGSPEMGAMNRLREEKNLSATAGWTLASAFAVSGHGEAARKLVADIPASVKPYREMGNTYGSHIRDKAFILEALLLIDDRIKAFEVLREIATPLGDEDTWLSTQETAMCLRAVSLFAGSQRRGEMKFDYQLGDGKAVAASTGLPLVQISVPKAGRAQELRLINKTEGVLFAQLIQTGTPLRGEEVTESANLVMNVAYKDAAGSIVNPARLEQGTQFIAEVTVRHPGIRRGYQNLALAQIFPPGWEIGNLRLTGDEDALATSSFSYQDIRDDRVYTYFDLAPGEEKTFRVLLTAAYAGYYYLPVVNCEAMYDPDIYARLKGQEVSVVKPMY